MKNLEGALLLGVLILSQASIAQSSLPSGILGGGATMSESGGRVLLGTIGQAATGFASSSGKAAGLGFWYTIDGEVRLTNLESVDEADGDFGLEQNYPNPFRDATAFSFAIKRSSRTVVAVFDVMGREVHRLVDEVLPAGQYDLSWSPGDLAPGAYFYRLQAGESVETRRMTVIR